MRPLLFILGFVLLARTQAQHKDLYLFGQVKARSTKDRLQEIIVEAIDLSDTTHVLHGQVEKSGKYELPIPFDGHTYRVVFAANEHPAKYVIIDLSGIPLSVQEQGLGMELEVVLFKYIPGVDFSVFSEPIGRSRYDPSMSGLTWDMEHVASMRPRFDEFMSAYNAALRQVR